MDALLATATFRSNTIYLWETATNRKLRDLSTSGQISSGFVPSVAFSRDNRLVAASAGRQFSHCLGRDERTRSAKARGRTGDHDGGDGRPLHRLPARQSTRLRE